MKYNKNNLVAEQSGQQWDTTSNSWNNSVWPIYSFYYLEDSNLSVHATVPATISAIVYPNPCSKILNIDVEWPIPQAFICKMYNAMGHIVMQWNEQEYKSYHKTIQVGNLPADNYILTLTGGKGRIVAKVTLR